MVLARTNETVRSALMELSADRNGAISPQIVLEAARDETSPLHDYFDWDDASAAERYRLVQARVLLRLVIPTFERTNSERIPIRLFTSVRALRGRDGGSSPSYIPSVMLLSNDDRRKMLVAQKLEQARFQLGGINDPTIERAFRFLSRLIERVDRDRGLIE